ncbi:Similar to MYO3A: Myosin-IIIa (Homo sapiens) [Cotesia congregata]|uniref:non-specific serine/threonine protein kinase n=1 Tax=Cotesia congregata TaxID=51543 RepID=A0A8J2H5B4_COTCN|nr:Similar to MYO3A: Myosin-IIIa (Homo sapiens) [Cotesia congregata]
MDNIIEMGNPSNSTIYGGLSQHIDFNSLPDPSERFELQDLIGEGTYGEVYAAFDKETDTQVAVKILENIADNIEEIEEEYLILRDLGFHPNLPLFYGLYFKKSDSSDNQDQLWFVIELCTGGSVTNLVQGLKKRGSRLTDNQIAYIIKETVEALIYMHNNNCMHRDVKGHNILLTEDEGEPPLSELHPMRALFQIPRNPPPSLKNPDIYSPELSDFIAECLVKDLEHRPYATELKQHPLLNDIDFMIPQIKLELVEEIKLQKSSSSSSLIINRRIESTTKHGKLKVNRKAPPKKIYFDDLAALDSFTEEIIVEQLEERFKQGQIYTYIGDILVAVNPYINLGLYTGIEQRRYRGQARSDNLPHIFAVADAAYQALLHQRINQSIIISGESGAGKTESANLLLKQLVYLSKAPNRNIEEQILEVNPIMEAFGNAATGINKNSSRFGKYLELTITKGGKVTGARIAVYLLEQSRGLNAQEKLSEYHLSSQNLYKYLTCNENVENAQLIFVDKFNQINKSFKVIGFHEDQVNTVYRVLAVILNLGNIEFKEQDSEDNNDDNDDNNNKCTVADIEPLNNVADLLGVESQDLLETFTSISVVTHGETIVRNNTINEAQTIRDGMAKGLYGRLFDWIVNQINDCISFNRSLNKNYEPLTISLLDIFGFENFSKNSFEQLCINIANEQIQYYFNQHIFTWEQQEYIAEGIPIDVIEFYDNRPVLDMLLSRPIGLLALLDEETRFPGANDKSLIEKFHNNIKSQFYIRPKSDALCFAVNHFSGRVVYQAEGFLDKNRNFLSPEVVQLIRQSQFDMIRFLFQCPITKTGNLYSTTTMTKRIFNNKDDRNYLTTRDKYPNRISVLASQSRVQQTVSIYFRYSLMDLLQKMVSGTPQFVRCIKPNDLSSPQLFDNEKVIKQLRYTGVLETIRIRQNGFSHRISFADFLKRYCFLAFGWDETVLANRDNCRLLLIRLKIDGWALGKTKVFLKYYHVEFLSKMYEEQLRKIVMVQAWVRRWLAKIHYRKEKWQLACSVVTLQRHIRGWLLRKRLTEAVISNESQDQDSRVSTPIHQAENLAKRTIQPLKDSDENIDTDLPKMNQDNAAVIIQSNFRGYTIRKKFGSELEQKFKEILNKYDKKSEAREALINEGVSKEDAILIVHRWYKREVYNQRKSIIDPIHPKLRQAELIQFSQNIHMKNQQIHKYLRRNKPGLRLAEIEQLPEDYERPDGFKIVEKIMEYRDDSQLENDDDDTVKYYKNLKDEMSSGSEFEEDEAGWDSPLIQLENDLHPTSSRPAQVFLEMKSEREDRIKSQGDYAIAPEQQLSDIWHKALRQPPPTIGNSGNSIRFSLFV